MPVNRALYLCIVYTAAAVVPASLARSATAGPMSRTRASASAPARKQQRGHGAHPVVPAAPLARPAHPTVPGRTARRIPPSASTSPVPGKAAPIEPGDPMAPPDMSSLATNTPIDAADETVYRSSVQQLKRGQGYAAVATALASLSLRNPYLARYQEAYGVALVCQALDQSARSAPDAGPGRPGRTATASVQQLFREGLQRIELAIRLAPEIPDFDETLGWSHLANTRLGLADGIDHSRVAARRAFLEALRLNPTAVEYWQALGDLYRLNPSLESTPVAPESRRAVPESSARPPSRPTSTPTPLPGNTVAAPSLGLEAYRRVSRARPRDAGLHFILYQFYSRFGQTDLMEDEIVAAQRNDPGNAVPRYVVAGLSLDHAAQRRGQDDEAQWLDAARRQVVDAELSPSFQLNPYRPSYPDLMAPALQRALGDSLTPQALDLYDRFKSIATQLIDQGNLAQTSGDPTAAEQWYSAALALGQRLVQSAMSVSNRYLLHLPELSGGLTIQERSLNALRILYDKYARVDRLAWMQEQQLALDSTRQIISRAAESAVPNSEPDRPPPSAPAP